MVLCVPTFFSVLFGLDELHGFVYFLLEVVDGLLGTHRVDGVPVHIVHPGVRRGAAVRRRHRP